MRHSLLKRTLVSFAALTAALVFAGPTWSTSHIHTLTGVGTLTDLSAFGAVSARDINVGGQVCGQIVADGSRRAYRWTPSTANGADGTVQILDLPKGYDGGAGIGLNGDGDVAGIGATSNSFSKALLWEIGKKVQVLSSNQNYDQAEGRAVNNAGNVTGWNPSNGGAFLSAVVNGKRKLFIIGEGVGTDINASGQIAVGHTGTAPYIWTPDQPNGTRGSKLYLEGATHLQSINDAGEAAGSLWVDLVVHGETYRVSHPMLYLPAPAYGLPAGLNDLGFPAPPAQGEWVDGTAVGISGGGFVVGYCVAYDLSDSTVAPNYPETARTCWLWDPVTGTMTDLNALLAGSGWVLTEVNGVNDARQIVGRAAYQNGAQREVLLSLQ